ncbi:hypothetical protein ARMGADRAFT_607221 [Armillaria gallica]|uniref:Uncharacterized protein n=1 Tax=Armillaria gallica TaxID=47427 RepID=A0A2H3CYW0_ARMGA|nr:hypothetical protein ARMGADRAFT_607221 [Armillaria gallica]
MSTIMNDQPIRLTALSAHGSSNFNKIRAAVIGFTALSVFCQNRLATRTRFEGEWYQETPIRRPVLALFIAYYLSLSFGSVCGPCLTNRKARCAVTRICLMSTVEMMLRVNEEATDRLTQATMKMKYHAYVYG